MTSVHHTAMLHVITSAIRTYLISSIYHKSVLIGRQHFDCLDVAMIGGYMQSCLVILKFVECSCIVSLLRVCMNI